MERLPIDSFLPEVIAALRRGTSLVVEASPGSGKTTRIPSALLDAKVGPGAKVLVLEPRRLAAKYAALRVAAERGGRVGDEVGYRFRFESAETPATKLLFLTEGMFLRRLRTDPDLRDVGVVVLDEFHERHLETDAALAALHWIRQRRPDLRIVVMSATLDAEAIERHLAAGGGGCERLRVEAPPFPLDISYLEQKEASRPLDEMVRRGVEKVLADEGDVLVFLPGIAEIRRCESALASLANRGITVFPLHGDLNPRLQAKALEKGSGRKVVLATNVAETSLTIPGVSAVVDTGLFRQAGWSPWTGIAQLKTRPITKAQAIQRAGRAARTGPGRCLRLYTRNDFDGLSAFPQPAIARSDLAQLWLDLKDSGVVNPAKLAWFETPPEAQSASASLLLWRLGATKAASCDAPLTERGKKLARFPAHPRLARLCVAGQEAGIARDACRAAALLAEDEIDDIDFLEGMHRARLEGSARRLYDMLLKAAGGDDRPVPTDDEKLTEALLAAFPDRVAKKRAVQGRVAELVLSVGGQAEVVEEPMVAHNEWFLALSVREGQGLGQKARTRAKCLVALDESSLAGVEPDGLVSERIVHWNDARGAIVVRETARYGQCILEERERPVEASPETGAALLEGITRVPRARWRELDRNELLRAAGIFVDTERAEEALARIEASGLGTPDAAALRTALEEGAATVTTAAQLRDIDWDNVLPERLLGERAHQLAALAPREITLPSGRRAKIRYRLGQAPIVGSRLQDFFGWRQAPTVGKNRIALVVELLAPNQRPLQVTRDLESFWKTTYPELRRQLQRRYPRHQWPEDPFSKGPSTK